MPNRWRETGLRVPTRANGPVGGAITVEKQIADIATRQHGVVANAQLRALGVTGDAARKRLAAGRLHRVHRGVYAVGHRALGAEGRWLAAVLACGDAAFLSHRSAAALWGIRPTERLDIDVSSPRASGRRLNGVDLHRTQRLDAREVTTVRGIPCTGVGRTLVDLAAVVPGSAVCRAVEQAEILRLFDLQDLDAALRTASRGPGTVALRSAVAALETAKGTSRSPFEERFRALCRDIDVPQPRVNEWIVVPQGELLADFVWRRERLVVETDGHRFHSTRAAFERDRRRDQWLVLDGWRVVRVTWRQLATRPDEVRRMVAALLLAGRNA